MLHDSLHERVCHCLRDTLQNWQRLVMQEQASQAQAAQSASEDMNAHLATLKEEIARLGRAMQDTREFSQELAVRALAHHVVLSFCSHVDDGWTTRAASRPP